MTEGAEVPSSSINRAQGNQLEIKTFALKYLPITTASEQETLINLRRRHDENSVHHHGCGSSSYNGTAFRPTTTFFIGST
ncbi:hypothetical protein ScPMuIL_016579 [Solemya velum]